MIDWNDIDFKNKKSGQVKVICPSCSDILEAKQKRYCV